MIFGSVCSGIEAASVAWHPLGWRASFLSEIEAAPRAVLSHHYADVPLHGDFTTIQAGRYDSIDILVGGTPCQSFSVAGLRGGLDDERGNLALEYLRLVDRLRPRWLVWENVPGVFSSLSHTAPDPCPPPPPLDLGCDGAEVETEDEYNAEELHAFNCFLAGVRELGYGLAYRVLDTQFVRVDGFGRALPQRRRRVFVVGYFGDWRRAAAVLLERASLSGDSAPRREAGSGASIGTLGGTSPGGGWRVGADEAAAGQLVAACLNGHSEYGADIPTLRAKGGDAAGGSEALLAFGGNDTRGPIQVSTAINAHGGPHGHLDFESEAFVAHSLRADGFDASEDGTGRGTPLVPVVAPSYAATLTRGAESAGKGGCAERRQEDDVNMIAFDTTQITSATNRCRPGPGAPCHPLAAGAHPPALAFGAQQGWAVRRLTPTECERLQGFPNGYTLVPFRRGMMADGPRYKMLGNSMSVNVMRWIGYRIAKVEAIPQAELVAA